MPSFQSPSCRSSLISLVLAAVLFACPSASADTPRVIDCDGIDDTALIQDALLGDSSYLLFPTGRCAIKETLKITNREGLRVEGSGMDATTFTWLGDSAETMFSVQNSSNVSFAQLGACVAVEQLDSAFDLFNACFDGYQVPVSPGGLLTLSSCAGYNPGTPPGTHRVSFEDISIGICDVVDKVHGDFGPAKLNNGIRVRLSPDFVLRRSDECDQDERADCNNDQHFFENVHVRNFEEAAFVLEGRASTGNTFTGCRCDGRAAKTDDEGGSSAYDYLEFGETCVRTGIEGLPDDTAGSFTWMGGVAESLRDSVFVLGSSPEACYVAGLHAWESRMLLRNAEAGSHTIGGVAIESSYFDTSHVRAWHEEEDLSGVGSTTVTSPGLMVDIRSSGPLSLRDNFFGERLAFDSEGVLQQTVDDVSICWSPAEITGDDDAETKLLGTFVFEGNGLITSNTNPFAPFYQYATGAEFHLDCVYPTTQRSNIVLTGAEGVDVMWAQMPQHRTMMNSILSKHSVSDTTGSHHLYSARGYTGAIDYLTDGFAGQRITIIGNESQGGGTAFHDAIRPGWMQSDNLRLPLSPALKLKVGETLTLVQGTDGYWYTVGCSKK